MFLSFVSIIYLLKSQSRYFFKFCVIYLFKFQSRGFF